MRRPLPWALVVLLWAIACDDSPTTTSSPGGGTSSGDLAVACQAQPTSGPLPLFVTFEARADGADSLEWAFGDGAGSSVPDVTHRYDRAGTYVATIQARGRGVTGLCRQTISVQPAPVPPGTANPNRPPRAYAKIEPTNSGPAPLTVTINACVAYDPDEDKLTHRIDFGDRSPQETRCKPQHTYQNKGTYRAQVCVSDGRLETCTNYTITAQ